MGLHLKIRMVGAAMAHFSLSCILLSWGACSAYAPKDLNLQNAPIPMQMVAPSPGPSIATVGTSPIPETSPFFTLPPTPDPKADKDGMEKGWPFTGAPVTTPAPTPSPCSCPVPSPCPAAPTGAPPVPLPAGKINMTQYCPVAAAKGVPKPRLEEARNQVNLLLVKLSEMFTRDYFGKFDLKGLIPPEDLDVISKTVRRDIEGVLPEVDEIMEFDKLLNETLIDNSKTPPKTEAQLLDEEAKQAKQSGRPTVLHNNASAIH